MFVFVFRNYVTPIIITNKSMLPVGQNITVQSVLFVVYFSLRCGVLGNKTMNNRIAVNFGVTVVAGKDGKWHHYLLHIVTRTNLNNCSSSKLEDSKMFINLHMNFLRKSSNTVV